MTLCLTSQQQSAHLFLIRTSDIEIPQAVYNFCEPVDEVDEKIVRVRVEADMRPEDVAGLVLDSIH